jgi:hypothetical protein
MLAEGVVTTTRPFVSLRLPDIAKRRAAGSRRRPAAQPVVAGRSASRAAPSRLTRVGCQAASPGVPRSRAIHNTPICCSELIAKDDRERRETIARAVDRGGLPTEAESEDLYSALSAAFDLIEGLAYRVRGIAGSADGSEAGSGERGLVTRRLGCSSS